jgi:hypothetical protein
VGIFKSLMGFGGVERVGDRILGELEAARDRGESQLVVGYTQSEIGIRGNASQMALFIRRKFEKEGFEVADGEGGAYGEDVRFIVRWRLIQMTGESMSTGDPDLAQFHRSLRAAEEAPPPGDDGVGMAEADIADVRGWMRERFAAKDYEAVWHRRLALGYELSGDAVDKETWFWVNAFSAQAALRRGEKDHPFVATSAGYADSAYWALSDRSAEVEEAMSEINALFFG